MSDSENPTPTRAATPRPRQVPASSVPPDAARTDAFYQALFAGAADAVLVFDRANAALIECNPAALTLFEAETGEQVAAVCPPSILAGVAPTPEPTETREVEFVSRRGRHFWGTFDVRDVLAGGRNTRLVRITDTSAQHRLLELHVATQMLAQVGGWEFRVEENRLTWSDEVYRIHELPPGTSLTVEEAIRFYRPDSQPEITAAVNACLADGTPFCVELWIVTAQGREVRVRANGRADRANGKTRRIHGACQDITEAHAAHEVLREREARLRQQAMLLDAANDAIVLLALDGRIRFWNRAAERVFGWSGEEARDQLVAERAFAGSDLAGGPMPAVLAQGAWSGELTCTTRAGARMIIESRWTLIRDEARGAPEAILTINNDVTEKKRIDAGILRTQRLESIGTLAGGIAHDLNNILSPILLSADMLRARFAGTPQEELIDTICMSARRGADVVRQVLSFARGAEGTNVPLNLRHVFPDVRKIVRETFPRHISCEAAAPHDLWNIPADPTQIHQVLLNLCLNAADAMPDGGVIRIEAVNFPVEVAFAEKHPDARPGAHVRLTVRDTGTGIPPEVRDRVFDPFFTTKGPGKGSGLGLSTVLAIVRGHGGFLTVENGVERGTVFKLYFPATLDTSKAVKRDYSPASLPEGRGELVLVIDDELSVRSIVRQSLEGVGYRVLTANDGAEGLAVFTREQATIALVLTDLMMPVLDGTMVLIELQRLAPHLRIVVMSGVTRSALGPRTAIPQGATGFLLKPFTLESLLKTIRATLDAPPPVSPQPTA